MRVLALVVTVSLSASAACATASDDSTIVRSDAAHEAALDAEDPGSDAFLPVDDGSTDDATTIDSSVAKPDAAADAESTTKVTVNTVECKAIACPAGFPYVVGCSVSVTGSSSQLCIVTTPGATSVLFKEGQNCGSETMKGTITCSTEPGTGLDTTNCTSNKTKPLYISKLADCPG